jgi:predicted PurR-regulated permease PerM
MLLVISVEPIIKKFMNITFLNKPISRAMAAILTYLMLIIFVSVILTAWFPVVLVQSQKLLVYVSGLLGKLNLPETINLSLSEFLPQISKISGGFVEAVTSSIKVFFSVFSIIIISIYMSSDWENIKVRFAELFSDRVAENVLGGMDEIEVEIAHWVKGQLILMLAVGLMSYVGLVLLDVDYPLALALFSGLLEVVPMIGPLIAGVFVGIIGFLDVPIKGLGIVAVYIVIQQLENNILVPKVMQKVSGFSPLIILIALLIASEFFGVVGAVLAVPATMVGTIVLRRVLRYTE